MTLGISMLKVSSSYKLRYKTIMNLITLVCYAKCPTLKNTLILFNLLVLTNSARLAIHRCDISWTPTRQSNLVPSWYLTLNTTNSVL